MRSEQGAKKLQVIAKGLLRFLLLLFLATCMGALIGAVVAGISSLIIVGVSHGIRDGVGAAFFVAENCGVLLGGATGFCFYVVAHWLVFRLPVERMARYLIGGTLVCSLPLSLIPFINPVFSLYGGMFGYWLGLAVLLIQVWREKRDETKKQEEQAREVESASAS